MGVTGTSAANRVAKDADLIIAIGTIERTTPPRLAPGQFAYGHIKTALTTRVEQLETFKDLTMSTTCDDAGTC
jgi:TPP-dependent trihydroxycyclohexane-1,2-dione (THcHDO) dehydratase